MGCRCSFIFKHGPASKLCFKTFNACKLQLIATKQYKYLFCLISARMPVKSNFAAHTVWKKKQLCYGSQQGQKYVAKCTNDNDRFSFPGHSEASIHCCQPAGQHQCSGHGAHHLHLHAGEQRTLLPNHQLLGSRLCQQQRRDHQHQRDRAEERSCLWRSHAPRGLHLHVR